MTARLIEHRRAADTSFVSDPVHAAQADPHIRVSSTDRQGEPVWTAEGEPALVRRAKDGDRGAFEELYREHVDGVARQVRFRLGSLDDDVVAEVFLRAWRGLSTYRDVGRPFGAWLHGIARYVILDELRRRGRSLPVDRVPDRPVDPMIAERVALRDAIDRLPEGLRRIIELKYLSDLTNEQTARELGLSVGAVNTKQWRALRALARSLEGET